MKLMRNYLAIAVLVVIPMVVVAEDYSSNKSNDSQDSFNIVGDWSGSPDCTISFYQDDGTGIDGNCDNGNYNHIISGICSQRDRKKIDIEITRVDVQKNCKTSVRGYLKIINENTIRFWQQGWHGCGVNTTPGSQTWTRK